ncbi:hypothetical protein BT93_L4992 [Corymbia citriodora subsp. variegata]|uniref:Major facilitator superfamily (MFS) profile domain-containing protein n=1 Tax=Corymbia citriodora subsp. variegata TaxID=360336 RepID=A0A8T0CGD3_CORYI|nr:hypothetical protein BT93_L4992 [Corymbia citriodora subsp. variegata]
MYVLGLAISPLVLAPASEYAGRSALYVLPFGIFLLLLVGTALVQNLGGFLVLRLLSGLFAGVTIANFGGTIADLWPRHQVGYAMSVFLWAAVCGSPTGYFLLAFVAQYYSWRIVIWTILALSGAFWLILVVVLYGFNNETRHSVILRRRVAKLHKQGQLGAHVPEDMQQQSVGQLFRITLSRPFRFLATEAVIICAALYNGYLYGLSFLFNDAFTVVYGEQGYGFNIIGVGLTFLGVAVGVTVGPVTNIWQERHYRKAAMKAAVRTKDQDTGSVEQATRVSSIDTLPNVPEARLQLGQTAGVTLPISLFWFAWSANYPESIHWIAPVLATVLFGWSFYTLILMTYMYVEDSYMIYSASALAGVGLVRNLAGAGFPLFGGPMFKNEGVGNAGTILGGLAVALIPIPFVLVKYGPRLRRRSRWASQHMDDE